MNLRTDDVMVPLLIGVFPRVLRPVIPGDIYIVCPLPGTFVEGLIILFHGYLFLFPQHGIVIGVGFLVDQ
jgi:hypothetical protein